MAIVRTGGDMIRARQVNRSRAEAASEVLRFVRDPLATFSYLQRTWGDVVPLPLPGTATVQFTHPEDVGEILRLPIKDEVTRSMTDIMGQGLLTADGAEWRNHRRMVTPAFSQKSVEPFL